MLSDFFITFARLNTASMGTGKRRNIFLKTGLWGLGIWVSIMVVVEITLSSTVLTDILNRVAAEYIDGSISFGKAEVSLFKRFPKATMTLEDFSITYPSERFDSLERAGVQGHMLYHGCSDTADTLASFKEFSASIRLFPLIAGKIHIPHVSLVRPRIFAHSYNDGTANWDIFMTGGTTADNTDGMKGNAEDEKSDDLSIPEITLGKISLTEHPHIIYTDCRDTIFAMIDIKRTVLNGRLKTKDISKTRIGLQLDTLFVAGRVGLDSLAAGLDVLSIHEHRGHMDVKAKARSIVATRNFGRIRIPVDINGIVSFPKDTIPAIAVRNLDINVATVPIHTDADIRLMGDKTGINARISIEDFKVQKLLSEYICKFIPEAGHIQTDALVNMGVKVKGNYDHLTGSLPEISASLSIPEAGVSYETFPHTVRVGLKANAEAADMSDISLDLEDLSVHTAGMHLKGSGGLQDLLGQDPLMSIHADFGASLDSLQSFIPDSLHMHAGGKLQANIDGSARISHLNLYNFSRADLNGKVSLTDIHIHTPGDSICVKIDTLGATLGPEEKQSRRDSSRIFRLLAINGFLNDADVRLKDEMIFRGKGVRLTAKNSIPEGDDTTQISYLGGTIRAVLLTMTDSQSSSILMEETSNRFQLIPKRDQPTLPMLTFSSRNKRITLKNSTNRAILTDSELRAKAAMNTLDRKAKVEELRDSLAKAHPDIPKDSLLRYMVRHRRPDDVPDWLKEEDFKKNDIDIRLDKTLAKYFREWDLDGSINVRTGIVMTPLFPLRNIIRGFECNFNNNEVSIDSLKFMTGGSEISAKGELTGLRRALLRNGTLKLDLGLSSDKLNANEILKAYNAGIAFNPEQAAETMKDASDSEFLKMVTTDTVGVVDEVGLIVVPSNLNADVRIDASNIVYSNLDINSLTARMLMKERCIQITDTKAESNMGDITFDGFYSTRRKDDLQTGFSLNLIDITAEKVISMMPSVDTIMPLLKSFKGLLNCEIAGTAQLDTNMNILMPTINGIMRISGEDLSISDNELFNTLAKKLLFKNKKVGQIDKMTVEGVIKDNVFEIFPFVLKIDRYTLAMSGIQNLDMSFKYHASVLKSPFLIRIGIDLFGDDFDEMKFKIGRAKYKNTNVPVYSEVIDDTKINLVNTIKGIFEKGVEKAIKESRGIDVIERLKTTAGYVNAVNMNLEALSDDEQKQLEAEEDAELQMEQIVENINIQEIINQYNSGNE